MTLVLTGHGNSKGNSSNALCFCSESGIRLSTYLISAASLGGCCHSHSVDQETEAWGRGEGSYPGSHPASG